MEALSPKEQASLLFDLLQRDSGSARVVTASAARKALSEWGIPRDAVSALEELPAERPISAETFFRAMQSSVGLFQAPGLAATARSDRERADAVFDLLDLDESGYIEMGELKVLLVSWGVTIREAESTIRALTKSGNGVIDREEFFKHFVPVWRYAWEEIKDSVRRSRNIGLARQSHATIETGTNEY